MPHHKSCIKRVKTNAKKREHNRSVKSAMRRAVKAVRIATDKETALERLPLAFSRLDKAAKRRIIHPNKADRTKSRLRIFINNL